MRALVTKSAAEHVCHAYGREYGLAVVSRAELIDRVEVLIGEPFPSRCRVERTATCWTRSAQTARRGGSSGGRP